MERVLLGICLFFVAVGCDNDDDGDQEKITEVRNVVVSGNWKITYFFDTDKEETENFEGYTFEFSTPGGLIGTKGLVSHSGSWAITGERKGDDSNPYQGIDFTIVFDSPPDFSELSEDWEILSLTNTKFELIHTSGGNGGTDLLTFEKI